MGQSQQLQDGDEPLSIARLEAMLPIQGLGYPLIYRPEIQSTNTFAMELIEANAQPGTLILTDAQPGGRGRQGRPWVTLPNCQILLSLILDLPFAPHWLVMATAVAARNALVAQSIDSKRITIKWPNDILLDRKKIAGILIETRMSPEDRLTAIVGIGINVNGSLDEWPEVAARATTILDAIGRPIARESIILAFLEQLGNMYNTLAANPEDMESSKRIWELWCDSLDFIGEPLTVHQGPQYAKGIAKGVLPDGTLQLQLDDGTIQNITWGDVIG
jgi:BirA family biotin operon repressor/biotin-[acetyl-CoA-carboxylase] ligase